MTFTQSHGCIISVDYADDEDIFLQSNVVVVQESWRWYVRRLIGLKGAGAFHSAGQSKEG